MILDCSDRMTLLSRLRKVMTIFPILTLALNVLWFGLGFRLFAMRPRQAVRLLVGPEHRDETSREALVTALPFLGGMNLAFAVLSAVYLWMRLADGSAIPWTTFLTSAIAHATQFGGNVPLALRGGRTSGAPWDVLQGPMRVIFVGDAVCALANAACLLPPLHT